MMLPDRPGCPDQHGAHPRAAEATAAAPHGRPPASTWTTYAVTARTPGQPARTGHHAHARPPAAAPNVVCGQR